MPLNANTNYFYVEAIRRGKWKLHIGKSIGWNSENEFPLSLYNLETDISESDNVADKYPEVVKELHAVILKFDASIF